MFNVQSLINEAIEKNNQARAGQRDGSKFHVSDAGTCYRKRYFKRLGIEPTTKIEIGSLRKMAAGDAGHTELQRILEKEGNLLISEGEVETVDIKGHFDGIVKHGEDKILLEIKTVEKWSMGYIKKDGAKPEHKIQMFTYWKLLREEHPDLDTAVLSYVKREDFEAKDFYFIWSEEIEKQVKKEWDTLIGYWNRKELPPCTCGEDYGGNGVKYCIYQDEESCCSEELMKGEKNAEENSNQKR